MSLDNRKDSPMVLIGENSIPRLVVEEGDEATLYHNGNLIMATITAIKATQIVGLITRSAYEPDLHKEYVPGKEIHFSEENIFGIARKKRQA